MTFRRLEIYGPLAALFLSLVGLLSTTASLDRATDSLEKAGQKFTQAHKASSAPSGLLLAGISER